MRKTKINSLEVDKIKADRQNGKTINYIVDKYGYSRSTIYRILRGDILPIDAAEAEVTIQEQVSDYGDDFIPIGHGKRIKCGLVKERHDMPADLYIFEEALSESLMFNYIDQVKICEKFINKNCYINNEPHDLICYVTGIQCALASLIKACYNMKVNLTLRHYNISARKYRHQNIWSGFGEQPYNDVITYLLGQSRSSYTYKCMLDQLMGQAKIFAVTVVVYDEDKAPISEMFLTNTLSNAYELHYTLLERMRKTNKLFVIFLEEVKLYSTGFHSEKLLKSSNN